MGNNEGNALGNSCIALGRAMKTGQSAVLEQLGVLFTSGSMSGVPDRQLLERFILKRDDFAEAAFAALVDRHGPMVLKVCLRILGDPHEAQDAFQATFILLATKAGRIANQELLANWLYGVALRTAMKARSRSMRRMRHERQAADRSIEAFLPYEQDCELYCALHEGINALPAKYRAPLVLCHFESISRERAAELLGCPVSTVGVRLMRARERLKVWLTRRHPDLGASLIAASLDSQAKAAVVTAALVHATTEAAFLVSTGATETVGAISASILELMREVQMSLLMSKLKVTATSLGVCGLFLAGFAALAQPQATTKPVQSAEQEILALEHAWGEALVNRDPAAMDRIVAYEMIGTDPGGHLWDKAAYVESVKSGAFRIESFELAGVNVHVYGDAAVATGRSIHNLHSRSGFARGSARFTDTYVRRNGCWQCVAWQSVGVPLQDDTQESRPQESTRHELKSAVTPQAPGSSELPPLSRDMTLPGSPDLPSRPKSDQVPR